MFPELLEINDFDPKPIIDASKKIYNFKNYFAYRLNLPDTGKPHESSSPLVDEALNRSMGRPNEMISISILVPLSLAFIPSYTTKERLTLDDLLAVKEHFHLLEHLYGHSSISLIELYKIKPVSESYTAGYLATALNSLNDQGLVIVKSNQNKKFYSVSFTIKEMINHINRILTEIDEDDHQNREYMYLLMHQLITWS